MTRLVLISLALSACSHDTAHAAAGFHMKLGDATVYELVDRRWNKRDKPARHVVLHADGTAEIINDKTDKAWITFQVKEDGTVLAKGEPVMTISEHGIVDAKSKKPLPVEIDGNVVWVTIDKDRVKVVLADDGNITVVDRPDGNKWRIDAKDKDVRRTAFLVLATEMKVALD